MQIKLVINGALIDGADTMDVVNPATGDVLVSCARASRRQVDDAVAAARAAFGPWSRTPWAQRSALLAAVADEIESRADELARLLVLEQGKALGEAVVEAGAAVAFIRHLSSLEIRTKVLEDGPTRRVEERYRPLGVVAAIVPWNFPLLMASFKLAKALSTGNTVVLKPSPSTPLTALAIGEIACRLLPPGTVNVVTDQNDLGAHLTSHPDVAKITFTGSSPTGKKVMASAAQSVKRVTLELGGNDAAVVLDDADPAVAAAGIFGAAFANSGQICIAIKRVYAHERIYEPLIAELARLANKAVVGDGLAEGTTHGPLQNRQQFDKVKQLVIEAKDSGKVVAGGRVAEQGGYFIHPTIVRDAHAGMRLVDDEQFGPILPIVPYTDLDDALRQVNDSPYGLGGSVWSSNPERAIEIAAQIEAGTVWVNKHLDFGPTVPFGGAKESGLGVEFAEAGLHEFMQRQIVNVARV